VGMAILIRVLPKPAKDQPGENQAD
jgi:hypothetical protein